MLMFSQASMRSMSISTPTLIVPGRRRLLRVIVAICTSQYLTVLVWVILEPLVRSVQPPLLVMAKVLEDCQIIPRHSV